MCILRVRSGAWLVLLVHDERARALAALDMRTGAWWHMQLQLGGLAVRAGLTAETYLDALRQALPGVQVAQVAGDDNVLAMVHINERQQRLELVPAGGAEALHYATAALVQATSECDAAQDALGAERRRYRALLAAQPTAARYTRSSLVHPGHARRRASPGAFEDA